MTAADLPRHLLGVWNPSYASDAMEATLQLLRAAAQEFADGGDADDLYVWWGKVRSQNRQQPLPHLDEIVALDAEAGDRELQLYLTDYRSLYVAHVGEIVTEDVREDDLSHVPAYYTEQELTTSTCSSTSPTSPTSPTPPTARALPRADVHPRRRRCKRRGGNRSCPG